MNTGVTGFCQFYHTPYIKCTPCQGQIFATMDNERAMYKEAIFLPV